MKLEKLKNGDWSCRLYLGGGRSDPVRVRLRAPSQKELRILIAEKQAEYQRGELKAPGKARSLRECYEAYIDSRRSVLSPSTLRGYISASKNSFQSLMDRDIDSLHHEEVQAEISKRSAVVAPKTIKNEVALFISVCAVYRSQPLTGTFNVPKKKKRDLYVPTREDVEALLRVCRSDSFYRELELPIMLGAFCGLRRGEIAALRYEDVDLKSKTVNISKALVLTPDLREEEKAPKSYAGYRSLALPPQVVDVIKARKRSGLPLIGFNLSQLSDIFRTVVKKAGVTPFRFHDLRHFFASQLILLGVPDAYAIRMTGHSTTSMLQSVYQHTYGDELENIRLKIAAGFASKNTR